MEIARPQHKFIPGVSKGGWLVWPRSKLGGGGSFSRLWAWVRGDSSCSTRRSWGAASESIVVTPRALTASFRPYNGVRPVGASDLERFALGKSALKPSSASGFEDAKTEPRRGSVAHLVGR